MALDGPCSPLPVERAGSSSTVCCWDVGAWRIVLPWDCVKVTGMNWLAHPLDERADRIGGRGSCWPPRTGRPMSGLWTGPGVEGDPCSSGALDTPSTD